MTHLNGGDSRPRLVTIEVVAARCEIAIGTIRRYERQGLVAPAVKSGSTRWYSEAEVERIGQIQRLTRDLGVNLAAVEVILHMRERLIRLQRELDALRGGTIGG